MVELLHIPVQVKLSEPTNVPDGQLSTHFPSDKKDPARHDVHFNWSTVDAIEKFGISQAVHFAPQAEEN